MNDSRVIFLYLSMLAAHLAHVLEEIWGRFWIMDAVFGERWFLVANWMLFCIPLGILYSLLQGRHWARMLALLYGVVMVLNGAGHLTALLVTGRYYGGFAGAYSGIALALIGVPMVYYLRKSKSRP
jgi:uncharacterized membrane protein